MKYVLENLDRCQAEGVVVMADHTRGLKPQAMKEFQIKRWTSSSLAAGQRKRGRRSKGAHQLIPAVTRPFGAWVSAQKVTRVILVVIPVGCPCAV